jgi:Rha family phage regulatory protein
MATSLQVAERFGKRHDTVLRAIQNLECSPGYRLRNFAESSYLNRQGKTQPMVEMTRDGFVILAMGFTGPQAMAWKESFIEAFNRLEQAYIEQIKGQAQQSIEAVEKRAFALKVPPKELKKHEAAVFEILSEMRREHDLEKRKLMYSRLKLYYRAINEPLPPLADLGPLPLLIETGPSREDMAEKIEAQDHAIKALMSALRGLVAASRPHLLPETAEEMPEALRCAAAAIKLAQKISGGAA